MENIVNELHFLSEVGIEKCDVVDLDSAKYLKLNGFNSPTHYYWLDTDLQFVDKGLKRVKQGSRRMNHNNYDEFIYSAPTKDDVIKWMKI